MCTVSSLPLSGGEWLSRPAVNKDTLTDKSGTEAASLLSQTMRVCARFQLSLERGHVWRGGVDGRRRLGRVEGGMRGWT